MKKIITFAFLMLTAYCSFAAYQYNVEETGHYATPYTNEFYEGTCGNYFGGLITGDYGLFSFYITDKINNLHSMSGNNEILSKVLKDFGYVDKSGKNISWTGNTVVSNEFQANIWNDKVFQTAYEIGKFSPGNKIKLWLQNNRGEISYSDVPIVNKWQGGYGLGGHDAFNTELAETGFDSSHSVFYGFAQSEFNGDNAPTGQPLPGFFASMIIGSSIMGGIGLRKKMKKVKKEA